VTSEGSQGLTLTNLNS